MNRFQKGQGFGNAQANSRRKVDIEDEYDNSRKFSSEGQRYYSNRLRGNQRGQLQGNSEGNYRGRFDREGNVRNTDFESGRYYERKIEADDFYDQNRNYQQFYQDDFYENYGTEFVNYSKRSRHKSDNLEYLERNRYSRDDIEFSEKDYDQYCERDGCDYDYYYHKKILGGKMPYGRDIEKGGERDHLDEKERYEDELYNRQDSFYSQDRQGDYQCKDQSNRTESYKYQKKENVEDDNQLYKDNRYADTRSSNDDYYENDYREKKIPSSADRQKSHYQNNSRRRKTYENTEEREMAREDSIQCPDGIQTTDDSCDWPINEVGIKMAIEFLKNKPSNDVSNTSKTESTQEPNQNEQKKLPVIKPEFLSQEAIEDLISDLLNIILTNGGEMTISALEVSFENSVNHSFKNQNVLKSFLVNYPGVFKFDTDKSDDEEENSPGDNKIVQAKTEVQLCQSHSTHPKSCNGDCNALHICKFYVLSSCEIIRCKFGHNLSDDHNIAVQQKFYLHRVELSNLCLLLQHDSNRCPVTVPIVCRFYNSMNGCRSDESVGNQTPQQKCPFLHICQKFVEGRCSVWSSCRRNHNLLYKGSYELLCKYGLDPRVLVDGLNRVLSLLQWSLSDFKQKTISKMNSSYMFVGQRKANENVDSAKQCLKRKVQVGGDDDISIKIQRVMETSLDSSLEENNVVDKFSERNQMVSLGPKIEVLNNEQNKLELRTTKNSPLENKNLIKAAVSDDGTMQKVQNLAIKPLWSISENDKWKKVSQAAIKDLEEKYQKYLAAKTVTVLMDGKYFEVDFTRLEGRYAGSSGIIKVQRNMVKVSEPCNGKY